MQLQTATARRQPVPAEDPDTEESRFHEERNQGLHSQGSAEDIAHVAAVFAPVHAELEFLYDTRDHANGKVDQEQFAPEFRHFAPVFIFSLIIAGLHKCHKPAHSQGQWDKKPVIDGG